MIKNLDFCLFLGVQVVKNCDFCLFVGVQVIENRDFCSFAGVQVIKNRFSHPAASRFPPYGAGGRAAGWRIAKNGILGWAVAWKIVSLLKLG